jgi:adenine phosphoribosyltransferase
VNKIPASYHLYLEGHNRDLRVVEVVPGKVSIAVLKLATDAELTEAVGLALFHRMPSDAQVLVMPDGKAQSLLHVLQRRTGLPAVLARKQRKSYMKEPVLDTLATSITTQERHAFYLDADDVALIKGRVAVLVDDVVSSGGTFDAMKSLLSLAGARKVVEMAVGTEGVDDEKRPGVIALHHFPVFLHE